MRQYTVKKCILKNEEGEFLSPFVIPASNEEIGTVKPDGKSIIISEDGTIEAKNVLIAGDNIQIDESNLLTASGGKDLFDVVMKDHILTYEEKKGYELLGEYVYKSAIAGERYGYPDFYAKCVEEYNNATTTKKYWIKNNINTTGVVQAKNIISNFTGKSGASIPTVFHGKGYFEFQIKFKLTDNTVLNPLLCTSVNYDGLNISISKTGLLTAYVSTNGTSWNEINGARGTHVYQPNVDYWVKGEYKTVNGVPSYTFSYSTDGENFTQEIYDYNIGDMYAAETEYRLGQNHTTNYLSGEIDLAETYIKQAIVNGVNNNWNGCDILEVKHHENGHEFYDISIKDTVDEYYAINANAWFFGIDEENERIYLPRNKHFPLSEAINKITLAPNWANVQKDITFPFTAPEDGWYIHNDIENSFALYLNGYYIDRSSFSSNNWPSQGKVQIYLNKGDVLTCSKTSVERSFFLPSKKEEITYTDYYKYMVVGNTISDTSWVDVVSQVEEGTLDIYEAKQISLDEIETTKTNAINEVEATGLGNKAAKSDVDGQWVTKLLTLLDSAGNLSQVTIDLSTYLPDDGYDYEVKFKLAGYDNDSTYGYYLDTDKWITSETPIQTDEGISSQHFHIYGGSYARQTVNILDLPVGINRFVKVTGLGADNIHLHALGYRRIGKNE